MRRTGKKVLRRVGRFVRKTLEQRIFYAIFQVTRVTNDHYGWRPQNTEDKQ